MALGILIAGDPYTPTAEAQARLLTIGEIIMVEKANYAATGTVFNIQKFSVNDGPGIRTVVFFKGCPLHCRWCANPESQLAKPQIMWDQKKCLDCRHCMEFCPAGAISIIDNHIHVSARKCNLCGGGYASMSHGSSAAGEAAADEKRGIATATCRCIAECPAAAMELEGELKTVQQVIDVVMQDEAFYEESNGGITLSGGEFLMQPVFAKNLLLAAKEKGLHTCCETTGYATARTFDEIIPHLDYLLFDMKHYDARKHKKYTGITNDLPLINMKQAIAMGKTVLPRIPVIPGFNDSLDDARGFAGRLQQVGAARCQLLPFHQFGENKYHLLDKHYEYENTPSYHREDLEEYRQVMVKLGIEAFF